jgi:hypothetical protein
LGGISRFGGRVVKAGRRQAFATAELFAQLKTVRSSLLHQAAPFWFRSKRRLDEGRHGRSEERMRLICCELSLTSKEFERLWHKVGVELKHRAVSRIGINNKFTVRKALRQVVRVLARDHAIAVAVRDEDREMDL